MFHRARRIIFVTSAVLSKHSAAIVNILEMCDALSKNGFDTTLCVPKFNLSKKWLFDYYGVESTFTIRDIWLPELLINGVVPGKGFIFSILAAKTLAKIECDIIYTRDIWVFFMLSVLCRRVCVLDLHQFRFQGGLQTFIYHLLVKYAAKLGNGTIVCISESLMRQWEKYGVERSKMCVAHDAVNMKKFHSHMTKSEARMKLGYDPNAPMIVYTGSLLSGKGVDILIRCANRLSAVIFVIVGGEKEQIDRLGRLVQAGNVRFVGHVSPSLVPTYQAAADVLALPNSKGSEIDDVTSPMKLFEYMASERPIVATDMPSLLEILEDGYNALISPAGDDSRLAENIGFLLANPSICEKLVQNARRDLDRYTWDTRVRFISTLF